jgi:hypothetical protein
MMTFNEGDRLRYFTVNLDTGVFTEIGHTTAREGEIGEQIAMRVVESEYSRYFTKATHVAVLPSFNPKAWGPSIFRIERPTAVKLTAGA